MSTGELPGAAVEQALEAAAQRLVPRLLTQADRDPGSSTFGCFDRNWWHYKIRDFPSVILQQGAYTAHLAGFLPGWSGHREGLDALAAAGARFWAGRARRWGAFEEYYPWERGYPPLAFSTLAVAKLVHLGVAPARDAESGMAIAVRQLERRFEPRAANQQVAGLAALAWAERAFPGVGEPRAWRRLSEQTLSLQGDEGWFVEYDGPDLGYLSVAIDCLWDLWDATQDPRYREAIDRALGFVEPFAALPDPGAGMHNARNTDYVVPYGIARASAEGDERAAFSLQRFFRGAAEAGHFLAACDDRYLAHYVGHSVVRGALLAAQITTGEPTATRPAVSCHFPVGGHLLRSSDRGPTVLVSLRKGGILTAWRDGSRFSDFGWLVRDEGRELVTHWYSRHWTTAVTGERLEVSGALVPHDAVVPTPLRHLVLRAASLVLGPRLTSRLKDRMIFREPADDIRFRRIVTIKPSGDVVVNDRITGLSPAMDVKRAPRACKRHVASADNWHPEDFDLRCGVVLHEEVRRSRTTMEAVTRYRFGRDHASPTQSGR